MRRRAESVELSEGEGNCERLWSQQWSAPRAAAPRGPQGVWSWRRGVDGADWQ